MSDVIKAALDAAARELCYGPDGEDCDLCVSPLHCSRAPQFVLPASKAIAAFIRACPLVRDNPGMGFFDPDARELWAAAIERAAGGGA